MKRVNVLIATLLIAGGVAYAGVNAARRYWQDSIPTPSMSWKSQYGDGDFSQVAYNIDLLRRAVVTQAQATIRLNERMDKLEGIDVNDVGDPNDGGK